MPCDPNSITINTSDIPTGASIPGFGVPFAPKLPNVNPFPSAFPEDLLDLLDKLKLLIPPGALQAPLNLNHGKDVFDGIMKLLDQFMPFLMLYKFFLPILELIICIIEVLCALTNPFKLIRALTRLFTRCIPAFLNLFPIFALVIMIISLLLLILTLVEYVVDQISKLVGVISRNIKALLKSLQDADDDSALAIAKKLGSVLCMFQNLFVLFSIFNTIIKVIKDILSLLFNIPPCGDGDDNDPDGCCTPDVCPAIVKQSYKRFTGTFKYLPRYTFDSGLPALPVGLGDLFSLRNESWQLYDVQQSKNEQFRNIFDGYDVNITPKPIFFPTDAIYSSTTSPRQAPYVVDMRFFYNPVSWGRTGLARFVQFKNCIVTNIPTTTLNKGNLTTEDIHNAVVNLAGGSGFEDDGVTYLTGFFSDGTTSIPFPATLENFVHKASKKSLIPQPLDSDGYDFFNIEYTFKPNIAPLLTKNIVTLGCVPSLALSKSFINNIYAGDIAIKTELLRALVNSNSFPSPLKTQECLTLAVATLRSNMTASGLADFQSAADICLSKLKSDTISSISVMIGIGFDPCSSLASLSPKIQFTTLPIKVKVDLKEKNKISLTSGIPKDVATNLAVRIKAFSTLGSVGKFSYDGYQSFTADLTSKKSGKGKVMFSFDNQIFCTNNIPENIDNPPSRSLQEYDYQFIYSPDNLGIPTAEGDTDGKPMRESVDISNDSSGNGDV